MSPLTEIPLDIALSIMAHLQPPDILSLRKTCKTLENHTRERQFWLTALQFRCQAHGIFKPSYTLESMTEKELEDAVLCPFKLTCSLAREGGQIFESIGTIGKPKAVEREILTWEDLFEEEEQEAQDLSDNQFPAGSFGPSFLVPGGRFLITPLVVEKHMLAIWDLGSPTQQKIERKPIACTNVGGTHSTVHATVPTPCGQGLRILLQIFGSTPWLHFEILEIFPLAKEPKFRAFKSILHLKHASFMLHQAVFGNEPHNIVVHYLDKVTVWDVEANTRITFKVGERFNQICAVDDHVILLKATDIMVWQVPSLRQPEEVEQILPAKHVLQLALPHHPQASYVTQILIASPNSSETKWISVISHVENGRFFYYNDLFELKIIRYRPEEDGSRDLSFSLEHLSSNDTSKYAALDPEWVATEAGYKVGRFYIQLDDLFCRASVSKVALIKEIRSLDSSEHCANANASSRMREITKLPETTMDDDIIRGIRLFCPYSGRLVILKRTMGVIMGYNQITVE